MTDPIYIDALGANGSYRARSRLTVSDVAGDPLVELSLVPKLFVSRTMSALRKADTLPLEERLAALAKAGELFATGVVDGMSAADYQYTVSRMSGTPLPIVREAVQAIARSAADAYRSAQQARPVGAVNDWRDPNARRGTATWIRRGDVFAVHAAGNHPGVHSLWLEAIALGYRVAVRPSRREPLTPYRLISALRASGFGDDQIVLLPTDYAAADEILRQADLSMVYGGQEVIDKYAADPTVLPNGPGRSKILITADSDWRDHIDMIVDSISHQGGTACVNTTAVFVEGDPTPVAEAIAERLSAIPSLPPEDDKAVLTAYSLEAAKKIEGYLLAKAAGTKTHLGGDGVVDELADGSAVLRPAVHQLDDPFAEQAGVELAFPCVWVAPWTREAGTAVFKDTLVLTAVTKDERLLDDLLADPTIKNLYIGDHPTYWMAPGVPHDAYLGEFLMRTKAVIRD
ncbi:aldehyde dehydrogenase family protein [Actinoallomurus purpureus]|uniref:aldehyde dehydrogenase family protein n=1 Tax=Actinoallomurus purpureus TaxID=478114 RepID=UPI002092FC08|nr:aldehyde dehydrogenase family protein [Actinoallomurus purpureus]MCO6005991.1 aldehyde dehydrogenase family protein [Actinoallomurus purpureus]